MTPHPQHTGRAPLTQAELLARAVDIIDAEGLSALSMRRLASEFDVEAMALYYHFPNKQAILDGVVNTVVVEALDGATLMPAGDWRDTMRSGILTVRRAMLAHPNVVPLITTNTADSPAAAVWIEGPLRILHDAGLRDGALVSAYHQIAAYVFGWHWLASGARETGVWHGGAPESSPSSAEAESLGGAFVSAELGESLADWSEGFEAGLDAILDSIDAEMRDSRRG